MSIIRAPRQGNSGIMDLIDSTSEAKKAELAASDKRALTLIANSDSPEDALIKVGHAYNSFSLSPLPPREQMLKCRMLHNSLFHHIMETRPTIPNVDDTNLSFEELGKQMSTYGRWVERVNSHFMVTLEAARLAENPKVSAELALIQATLTQS